MKWDDVLRRVGEVIAIVAAIAHWVVGLRVAWIAFNGGSNPADAIGILALGAVLFLIVAAEETAIKIIKNRFNRFSDIL